MAGYIFNVLNLSTGELITDNIRNRATIYRFKKSSEFYINSPVAQWYISPPDKPTLIDIASYLHLPLGALEVV